MKSYEEMANDVFRRRDAYETAQRVKRKRIAAATTSLCGLCLVALMGFGVWQSGVFHTTPPTVSGNPLPSLSLSEGRPETSVSPESSLAMNNKIVVNPIKSIPKDKMNICLLGEDFVKMTLDEMKQYYGVDIEPVVPADIQAWEMGEYQRYGIFRRDGGTGEAYWDSNVLNYSSEDFQRSVHVEIDKGNIPLTDCLFFSSAEEKSIINNTEVLLGLTEDGCYYAEFMYHDVGFILDAEGVSQDEFVAIVASIID